MPLPPCRAGESDDLHVHRGVSYVGTLADPEEVVWSSIRHLCAPDVIRYVLEYAHGIKNRRRLEAVTENLRLKRQLFAENCAQCHSPPVFEVEHQTSELNASQREAILEFLRWL